MVYKSLTVMMLGLALVFADACAFSALNPDIPFVDLLYEASYDAPNYSVWEGVKYGSDHYERITMDKILDTADTG